MSRGSRSNDSTIAFVTPCVDEAFFDVVKKGAADAAAETGARVWFDGTQDVDIASQIRIVLDAVSRGATAIALSVIHPTAFSELVAELQSTGIPVVAFNVNAGVEPRLTGVCQNVYRAGLELGRRVRPLIEPGSRVLLTVHSDGISALDDRCSGILESLRDLGLEVDRITTGIDPVTAARRIDEYVSAHGDVRAILATGLADTEGAGIALAARKTPRRCVAAGFDLSSGILDAIRIGALRFTIDQQQYLQGYYPVMQLVLQRLHGLIPTDIDTGAAVVSRDEVDAVARHCAEGYR